MDISQRRQQLERRISDLECQIKRPPQGLSDPRSANSSSLRDRTPLSEITSAHNTCRPPMDIQHNKRTQQEIKQLNKIVRETLNKQNQIQSQILSLKDVMARKAYNVDRRSGYISSSRCGNRDQQQDQRPLRQSVCTDRPSKLQVGQGQVPFICPEGEHLSVLDQESPGKLKQRHLMSKSLSVTNRIDKRRFSRFEDIGNLGSTVQGTKQGTKQGGKHGQISVGTKKYMASMIIMRMSMNQGRQAKKPRSDYQFLELMEKREKTRETLLKKIYKTRHTKKYK